MKIIIIIFIYVLFSIIFWKKYNETYINESYITIFAVFGLNNRLNAILNYLYKANKENKKLRVIWYIDYECPDIFDNLFKPIDNVEFIYIKDIRGYDYNSSLQQNNRYIEEKYYNLLQPIDSIQYDINNTKMLLKENYIACHLRRTDGWNHYPYIKDRHNDEEYMEFIDKYPIDLKIYIATDCRVTQKKFIKKYGNRLIYKKILNNNDKRQTSLQDAVKEMYVCADAKYFMRSPGTFSNTIMHIRNIKNSNEYYDNNLYKNTIVAAYFSVKGKRPSSDYHKFAKNFLKIKNPIVLYTSQDNYDIFMELRGDLPIKIIIQDFEDIYMWKMYKDKWIKHYEELDTYFIKCSPQLFAIWSNKVIWLEDAINHNYFNTKYFQYTDFGSFRYDNLSEDIINNYPIINKYEDDRILISLLINFEQDDYETKNNIIGNFDDKDRIDGSSFGGSIKACLKYRIEYEKILNLYFDNDYFAGKDEAVISSLILAQPELFTLVKKSNFKWFYLQEYLSINRSEYDIIKL